MFDICPNCHREVIFNNPKCTDHRTPRSLLILNGHPSVEAKPVKESKKQARAVTRPSLEELLNAVAEEFLLEPHELKQKHQGMSRTHVLPKRLFCYIARFPYNYKAREVAAFLGVAISGISYKTVTITTALGAQGHVQKHHAAIMERIAHVHTA